MGPGVSVLSASFSLCALPWQRIVPPSTLHLSHSGGFTGVPANTIELYANRRHEIGGRLMASAGHDLAVIYFEVGSAFNVQDSHQTALQTR